MIVPVGCGHLQRHILCPSGAAATCTVLRPRQHPQDRPSSDSSVPRRDLSLLASAPPRHGESQEGQDWGRTLWARGLGGRGHASPGHTEVLTL